jgi:hypothetical protein
VCECENFYLNVVSNYDYRLGNSEQAWKWLKQAEQVSKKVPGLSEMFASIKQELHESLN